MRSIGRAISRECRILGRADVRFQGRKGVKMTRFGQSVLILALVARISANQTASRTCNVCAIPFDDSDGMA